MHIPVDERYLVPEKDDLKNVINYLNIDDIVKNSIREMHKFAWIIMIWIRIFGKNSIVNKFLNDIFTNLLSGLHTIKNKDVKLSSFLLRNSIEDFLRFYKIYENKINITDSPDIIFECIFSNCDDESFVHKNFEVIRSVYRECCLYVHSANLKDDNLCSCLENYKSLYSKVEIDLYTEKFVKIFSRISNLIIINNKRIFDQMSYND